MQARNRDIIRPPYKPRDKGHKGFVRCGNDPGYTVGQKSPNEAFGGNVGGR